MNEPELRFRPEDITGKLRNAYRLGEEEKRFVVNVGIHLLVTNLTSFITGTDMLLVREEESIDATLKEPAQRAYAGELNASSKGLADASQKLMQSLQKTRFPKKSVDELAERYHKSLGDLIRQLPIYERLKELGELDGYQERIASSLDVYVGNAVYSANRFFAPEFQKYLHDEISSFSARMNKLLAKDGVSLVIGEVAPIETRDDYVTFAVLPLVCNAAEHAFNQKNDVHGRMQEKGFRKEIRISGRPDDGAKSEYYVVEAEDNGFGISSDVLPRLFERGATSKPGNRAEHGVGLWGTKYFVERNGGIIDAKTEPGKGTVFRFTIPYCNMKALSLCPSPCFHPIASDYNKEM